MMPYRQSLIPSKLYLENVSRETFEEKGENKMPWIGGNRFLNADEMNNNATMVWGYFGSRGWSLEAVSAMLGNMQSESSINPNIWEGLTVDYSRGYGLVQWTPATKYINWAGADWQNGDKECERILYESNNNIQWFANPQAPIVNPPISFKEFTTSTLDVVTLANYFLWYYEHPAVTIQPNRGVQAQQWYTFLSGKPPEPSPSPTAKSKLPLWAYSRLF